MNTQQQFQQYIDTLMMEKEEMVRRHTIETGELRKKNAILEEQLQRFENATMSNTSGSAGLSNEFSDFDNMTGHPWDNFSVANEFTIEGGHRLDSDVSDTSRNDSAIIQPDGDKNMASGFLLMLLLCGAWVASRNSNSPASILPAISEDMRAASATVLDNLYKDTGIQLDGVSSTQNMISIPSKTSNSLSHQKTVLSAFEVNGIFHSSLDNLHHRLTTPSQQQLKDQAFSLSASQYDDLSSGDVYAQQAYIDHQNAKNVGEALGAVHNTGESTVAETYTRSLLKDKVSTQVLKDFARMVAESNMNTPSMIWKSEQ
jgi:hypothetical protein